MKQVHLLMDKSKRLIHLVNCKVYNDHLTCGAAIFRGGLKGKREVFCDDFSVTIKIPSEVTESQTYISFVNEKDELIFYYA
jgi:hypothetical protein